MPPPPRPLVRQTASVPFAPLGIAYSCLQVLSRGVLCLDEVGGSASTVTQTIVLLPAGIARGSEPGGSRADCGQGFQLLESVRVAAAAIARLSAQPRMVSPEAVAKATPWGCQVPAVPKCTRGMSRSAV